MCVRAHKNSLRRKKEREKKRNVRYETSATRCEMQPRPFPAAFRTSSQGLVTCRTTRRAYNVYLFVLRWLYASIPSGRCRTGGPPDKDARVTRVTRICLTCLVFLPRCLLFIVFIILYYLYISKRAHACGCAYKYIMTIFLFHTYI